MKKILLSGLLLLGCLCGWAQEYVLEYDVSFYFGNAGDRSGEDRFYLTVYHAYTSGTTATPNPPSWNTQIVPQQLGQLYFYRETGRNHHRTGSISIPASSRFKMHYIYASSGRQKKEGWLTTWWDSKCSMDNQVVYQSPINTQNKYFKLDYLNFHCLNNNDNRITFNRFEFYAKCALITHSAGIDRLLPADDKLTITATAGFPADVYRWEYRDPLSGTWKPVADQWKDNNHIHVSAKDLFGDNLEAYLGRTVAFRIDLSYDGTKSSNMMDFTVVSSAPHILSVDPVPNKCFGEENGRLKINFDRPLYRHPTDSNKFESLNISITGTKPYSEENIFQLAPDNSFTTPAIFPKGSYVVKLLGKYPHNTNHNTYTEGAGHTDTVSFEGPEALSFQAVKRDVYCNGGNDATISITAAGGVGNYRVHYKKEADAPYAIQAFEGAQSHLLTGLSPTSYLIYVSDSNGCIMHTPQDNPHIERLSITEPAPLAIDYRESRDPLAYGYTDGWACVVIKGGTPYADGSYRVQWTDSLGNPLSNVSNELDQNGYYRSTLHNVGDGRYEVRITDSNYTAAQAERRAACERFESFRLIQPPPLIAEVIEHHYVSCRGFSDGQLHAKAKGGIEIPTKRYLYKWYHYDENTWNELAEQTDSIAANLPAGVYRAGVTDKNNITRFSDSFTLVDPELLRIQTWANTVACNGDSTGAITAEVTGGTAPYHYEWSKGDTVLHLRDLRAGLYFLTVEDSRGCLTQSQTEVKENKPLTFDQMVVQSPSCIDKADGFITQSMGGGTPPYTIEWNNGLSTPGIDHLAAGIYTMQVTDSEGCRWTKTYELKDPPPVPLHLGPDRTLCAEQIWEADATVPDGVAYQWESNAGFASSAAKVTLNTAGTYYASATTTAGCTGRDTITIHKSSAVISAVFTAPTQGYTHTPVVFVNISQPRPESIEWIIPAEAHVVSKTDDRLELLFAQVGHYEVGIQSRLGECEKLFVQHIAIMENTQLPVPEVEKLPFIVQFYAAPNPSKGVFHAYVELKEESNIRLRLLSIVSGQLYDDRRLNGSKTYNVYYDISLPVGIYVLMLETGGEQRVFKILSQ